MTPYPLVDVENTEDSLDAESDNNRDNDLYEIERLLKSEYGPTFEPSLKYVSWYDSESFSYLTRTVLRYILVIILALNIRKLVTIVLNHLDKVSEATARDIMSITGLVLIIFAIVAVVLLVESRQIISTAVGVLGTIAGYLFGTIKERLGADKLRANKVSPKQTVEGDPPPEDGQNGNNQPVVAPTQP